MRLGLIIYGSLDTLSGGYLYDRKLVEHLQAQGDTVEVISLPWSRYVGHLAHNFSPALLDRLARLEVDVLLQDELNHPSLFWLNRRLKGRVRYPFVSIVHHLRSSEAHPTLPMRLYCRVERAYLNTVQGFIFNSQTTRAAVEQLIGRPADGVVAYPGGDRFGEGLSESAIRVRANRQGPLRMLFVGNLIPRKGLHTLIQALGYLPKWDWTLHVVGPQNVDPAYTAQVKTLVTHNQLQNRVIFLGSVKDEYMRDEWRRSDLLVVPSQYEGFGIVYLEGMSFGLPAVASTGGAAGEMISDGENGFLVRPNDPLALAGCLENLLRDWSQRDRSRLERISLAARRRYAAFPTWESSAAAIRAYLQTLTA